MRGWNDSRLVLLAVCLLAAGQAVQAGRVRVPVPFRIDQADVFSSMAMEVDMTDLGGLPVSAATEPLPPDLQALFKLVRTLQAGDPDAVLELVKLSPNENPMQRRQLIEGYQKAFDGLWDSLRLLSRYDLTGYSTYTWVVDGADGPYVRSFSLAPIDNGFKWVDDTQHDLPHLIDTLLMKAEQMRVDGIAQPRLPDEFRYAENLRGSGVTLLFDGAVLRWDVFTDPIPQLPVAEVFQAAYGAFRGRDMEGFASHWTPYSAAKFRDWIAAMPAAEFEAYFADVTRGLELRFVIEADPVFVVYQNTTHGVRYATLVREGDRLSLTNFYIGGLIDALLEDRNLFVLPVVARLVSGEVDPIPSAAAGQPPVATLQAGIVPAAAGPAAAGTATDDSSGPAAGLDQPAGHKFSKAWLLLLIPLIAVILLKRKSGKS